MSAAGSERGACLVIGAGDGLGASIARHQSPNLAWFAYSFVFALVALFGGFMYFKYLEPAFAESI